MWHMVSHPFFKGFSNMFYYQNWITLHNFLTFIFDFNFIKFFKRAVNFFCDCCIFFLADHTSVFCSSFVDLHILIPCWKRKYAFWHIFLHLFLHNIPHISQSCSFLFGNFLFHTILLFDILVPEIKYNRKLLCVIHAEVSNFSDEVYCGILDDWWCSYLLQIVHI